MWIGLFGFILMVYALVMLVVNLIRKRPMVKMAIALFIGFALFIFGVGLDDGTVNTVTDTNETKNLAQDTEDLGHLTSEEKITLMAEHVFGDNLDKVEFFDATDGNRINIFAQVSDNFTNNSIRHGFNGDVVNFLEAVEAEEYNDIFVKGYFDMVDAYGDVENQNIFNMRILKSEVDKINYENFDYDNLENLSETYNWHDTFNE